jgi:hypothetical protein
MGASKLPIIITDPIELSVIANTPFTVPHGLGRQIGGYWVVWSTDFVQLKVADPAEDTRLEITLIADASVDLRLVLL